MSPIRRSLLPLGEPNFRLFFLGAAVSHIGTWMQKTAFAWLAWDLTESATVLGQVAVISLLPALFLGPWAGAWADRHDRRRLVLVGQWLLLLLAAALALLAQQGEVPVWSLYLFALANGVVYAFEVPAYDGLVGDLGSRSDIRSAVALNASLIQMSRLAGPALAGMVIATSGVAGAFWLNAASFLCPILALSLIQVEQTRSAGHSSALEDFAEAIRVIRADPRLADVLLCSLVSTFFGWAVMNIAPAIADHTLQGGADVLGLLLSASGAGALLGALAVVPLLQSSGRTGGALLGSLAAVGLALALFPLMASPGVGALLFFLAALPAPTILAVALLQEMAPPAMRARVMALWSMLTFGTLPLSSYLLGVLADRAGPAHSTALFGVAMLLSVLLAALLRPSLRAWQTAAETTAPPHQAQVVAG